MTVAVAGDGARRTALNVEDLENTSKWMEKNESGKGRAEKKKKRVEREGEVGKKKLSKDRNTL